LGQKIMLWLSGGQEFQFLSYLFPLFCLVLEIVLQIKHCRTRVVMFCLHF